VGTNTTEGEIKKMGHPKLLSLAGISEDWKNEISRENLSEILKKADGLIRFRATGMVSVLHRGEKIGAKKLAFV
jgi:hypothetical protein